MGPDPQPATPLDAETSETVLETVFELHEGRQMSASSKGLFRSLEGAQAHAATIHQTYLDRWATMTEEEREDTEPVTATLTWNIEQPSFSQRHEVPMGDPLPTARYCESSSFKIRTRAVNP